MEIAYAFLADAVEVLPTGRFFVFGGGLDAITTQSLPSVLPTIALLVKFRLHPNEIGLVHRIRVVGRAPDGTFFIPEVGGDVGPIDHPVVPGLVSYHVMAVNIKVIPISQHGTHVFTIYVNDNELQSLSLHSIPIAGTPAAGGDISISEEQR